MNRWAALAFGLISMTSAAQERPLQHRYEQLHALEEEVAQTQAHVREFEEIHDIELILPYARTDEQVEEIISKMYVAGRAINEIRDATLEVPDTLVFRADFQIHAPDYFRSMHKTVALDPRDFLIRASFEDRLERFDPQKREQMLSDWRTTQSTHDKIGVLGTAYQVFKAVYSTDSHLPIQERIDILLEQDFLPQQLVDAMQAVQTKKPQNDGSIADEYLQARNQRSGGGTLADSEYERIGLSGNEIRDFLEGEDATLQTLRTRMVSCEGWDLQETSIREFIDCARNTSAQGREIERTLNQLYNHDRVETIRAHVAWSELLNQIHREDRDVFRADPLVKQIIKRHGVYIDATSEKLQTETHNLEADPLTQLTWQLNQLRDEGINTATKIYIHSDEENLQYAWQRGKERAFSNEGSRVKGYFQFERPDRITIIDFQHGLIGHELAHMGETLSTPTREEFNRIGYDHLFTGKNNVSSDTFNTIKRDLCVPTAYGAKNGHERIAEFVDEAYTNPQLIFEMECSQEGQPLRVLDVMAEQAIIYQSFPAAYRTYHEMKRRPEESRELFDQFLAENPESIFAATLYLEHQKINGAWGIELLESLRYKATGAHVQRVVGNLPESLDYQLRQEMSQLMYTATQQHGVLAGTKPVYELLPAQVRQ